MNTSMKAIRILLVVLLALPSGLRAQDKATPTQNNWQAIAINDELFVELKNGKTVKGRVKTVDDQTLNLTRSWRRTTAVNKPDVQRVYRLTPKSAKKATLIGMAIGAGIGAAWGTNEYYEGGESGEQYLIVVPAALGAGLGALTGYLVGKGKRRTLIYESK